MHESVFNEIADLALKGSGQALHYARSYLIEARLAPILRREGFGTVEDLVHCLKSRGNPVLVAEVTAALTGKETCFFSDRDAMDLALSRCVNTFAREPRLRIWCAGVSTGQEAFSLAMRASELGLLGDAHRIEITATDLSRTVLQTATAATYNHYQVQQGLSIHRLLAHFEKQQSGDWQVSDALRAVIGFRPHNLMDSASGLGRFHLILCRNVLSGLSRAARGKAAEHLAAQLEPGGAILTGPGESLYGLTARLEPGGESAPSIWVAAGTAQASAA
jgi:chemotaxis protein methyltransferase CheR